MSSFDMDRTIPDFVASWSTPRRVQAAPEILKRNRDQFFAKMSERVMQWFGLSDAEIDLDFLKSKIEFVAGHGHVGLDLELMDLQPAEMGDMIMNFEIDDISIDRLS
jgi:hypothetical protein